MTIYQRWPLQRDARQFRILRLHPPVWGAVGDELQGSLSVHSLDETRNRFATLSYVWGDPFLKKVAITINGQEMYIARNLASALYHLRNQQADRGLDIWVDAICINQKDNNEKSDQVRLMSEIYQNCSHVNIWLPDPAQTYVTTTSNGARASLKAFLSRIAAAKHVHEIPGYYIDEKTGSLAFKESNEFMVAWRGVELVMNSPWWTRAWTAQEVFLPQRAYLFYGDAEMCDFQTIEDAASRFHHTFGVRPPCCAEAISLFPPDKMSVLHDFMHDVGKIMSRRQAGKTRPFDGRDEFFIIVKVFADRRCAEPRDRVYSLWSQARNKCFKSHKLDYTRSLEDVFTDVFARMLEEARTNTIIKPCTDFRVLYGLGFGINPRIPGKPSWVLDLTQSISKETWASVMARMACSRLYRASGWKTGRLRVAGNELHLQGVRVDTIWKVGQVVETVKDGKHLQEVFAQWWDAIRTAIHDRDVTELRGELARLVCADVYHEKLSNLRLARKHARFAFREAFNVNWIKLSVEIGFHKMANEEVWRRIMPWERLEGRDWDRFFRSGDIAGLDNGYSEAVSAALQGRAMFLTEQHRQMGLCLPQAREGDKVWVVHGARLPFVMRPLFSKETGRTVYHLIGDCYLHGAMDGGFADMQYNCAEDIVVV